MRAPNDEKNQHSAARRERAGRKPEADVVIPDTLRQAAPGRPRQSASRRAKVEFEKQNIEAQRASRQERRQQRQEQAAAEAREQVLCPATSLVAKPCDLPVCILENGCVCAGRDI